MSEAKFHPLTFKPIIRIADTYWTRLAETLATQERC